MHSLHYTGCRYIFFQGTLPDAKKITTKIQTTYNLPEDWVQQWIRKVVVCSCFVRIVVSKIDDLLGNRVDI